MDDEILAEMRKKFLAAFSKNKKIAAVLKRVSSGKASFADTAKYSEAVSILLGEIFSENLSELSEQGLKEYICTELLRDRHEDINSILAQVQTALDAKTGIKIAPQKAPFPLERVQKATHSLEDVTVSVETIRRRAEACTANISRSFHDDYVQSNAQLRSDVGLKCYIVRETNGRCCNWCSSLAGRYVYGEHPDDIFRRHDNCDCTVTFESGRTRQNAWTKRSWETHDATKSPEKPNIISPEKAKELQEKNLPKSLTGGGNGGIISIRGNGKGSIESKHIVEQVGSIDFTDNKAIAQSLQNFEEKYKNSNIEHCRVITASGEVYDIHGDKYTVDTTLLGDKMKGSINEHNHVTGESQYSFSYEDFESCIRDGSKTALAYDEKYRYIMELPDIPVSSDAVYNAYKFAVSEVNEINFNSFVSGNGKSISDEDYQHEIIKRACKKVGVRYDRQPKT